MNEQKPRRPRRKTISVSSQTFFHLTEMAKQEGYNHPGKVVDKIMRDMMIERRSAMRRDA
jgi:hypothetical protein